MTPENIKRIVVFIILLVMILCSGVIGYRLSENKILKAENAELIQLAEDKKKLEEELAKINKKYNTLVLEKQKKKDTASSDVKKVNTKGNFLTKESLEFINGD